MAIHTELPIYRTGVRLLTLAVKVQEQMPRSMKRALGEKINQHCVDMLDLMAMPAPEPGDGCCTQRRFPTHPLSSAAQTPQHHH